MSRRYALPALLICFVSLVLLGPGCDELVTEITEVTTAGHPTADFTVVPDSGCVPLTVTFQDQSDGPRTDWLWDFGDGETSTDTNPTHTYESTGLFTVTLTIENEPTDGEDTEIKTRSVVVGQAIDSFYSSIDSGCSGLEVSFTPVNAGGVSSWSWNFGDSYLSDTSHPTHVYDSVGIHQVRLVIKGGCGSDTLYDTIQIVACAEALFYADVYAGCAPLTVQFWDTSVIQPDQAILERAWDFDGGTPDDSTISAPNVEFADTGTYEVTLTVTLEGGGSASVTDTIRVYENTSAAFTAVTDSTACYLPSQQFQVKFRNESDGLVDSLRWNFGDGTFLFNDSTPVHAYTTPGVYTVGLTVWGCVEDSTEKTDYIVLSDTLEAGNISFTITPGTGTTADIFQFVDNSSGVITSWIWDFGDGDSATADSVTHVFSEPNTYEITLTIGNECGEVQAVDTVIVVSP